MAAPGGKFFIQEQFGTAKPHHESYKALWETKWQKPVSVVQYDIKRRMS